MRQKLLLALCVLITNVLTAQLISINEFENGPSSAFANNAQYRYQLASSVLDNYSFNGCNIPTMFGSSGSPSSTVNNNNSLASVTSNTTYLLGGIIPISTVGPIGQNLSMRLGNRNPHSTINPAGYRGMRVSYTQQFIAQYSVVSFTYLVHFNSDHYTQLDIQPFFTARLLDMGNNIISTTPPLCLKADSSDPRLITQGSYTYMQQWVTQKFLIPDNYIGQNIKIQFVTTDCGLLGHQGVAYIDNIMLENTFQSDVNFIGSLSFETGQINCPEDNIEVCLDFSAPDGYTLSNLTLNVHNINTSSIDHTINITNFSNNTNGIVCFEIDRDDLPIEGGNFNFSVSATFITPDGNTHEKSIYSPTQPHLTIGNNTPFFVTNPSTNPGDLDIIWTNLNTTYEVEYVSDEYCCPNHEGHNNVDSTIYSLTTTSTNIYSIFYTMAETMTSKCLRFRIRPVDICNNYNWSDWCCVTSYTPSEGGYDPNDPNDRHNICLEIIDLDDLTPYNPQPQSKPSVSPNPTTGNITVVNSNSTIFDIYDLSQNKVKAIKTVKVEEKVNIDLSDLKSGIYILKLNNNQDIKIIKQ
ncbi:MAG: T9SS type A sorting domain-containing protein [Myroides sp.]|nr:T9SS type A sorting domain-containing protein [Myroides sp.]